MNSECAYLIDSSIYFFRYYFSDLPSRVSASGREVSGVLAFTQWLLRFLETQQPALVAACFDESLGSCFRNEIDPEYKANRALPDESLAYELLAIRKVTELLGVPSYSSDRFEADDLIASLAAHARAKGHSVTVVSRDKDLGQVLLGQYDELWDAPKGERISEAEIEAQFGVRAEQIADFLAIIGDPVDNIVGVPGIGKKTAAALLQHFSSWEQLKNRLDELAASKLRGAVRFASLLGEYSELVDINLQLTRLDQDCLDAKDVLLKPQAVQVNEFKTLAEEFNFPPSLLKRAQALHENSSR